MAEVAALQIPIASPAELDPAKAPVDTAPKSEKVSQSLSVLVQREKRALERERAAQRKEQEFEAKLAAFAAREAKVTEFESLKDSNPLKALEYTGHSYKTLTEQALNDGNVPPEFQVQKLKEEFEAWKKSQEEDTRKKAEFEKEAAVKNETKVIEDFKGKIQTYVESDPKKYELIQFDGQMAMVYEVIDENYSRTIDPDTGIGKVMSIEEAADKVEKWLRETKYARATELEFFKSKAPPQAPNEVKQTNQFRPTQNRTLTNELSSTPTPKRSKPITDDERVQRAIAYAKGLRP